MTLIASHESMQDLLLVVLTQTVETFQHSDHQLVRYNTTSERVRYALYLVL